MRKRQERRLASNVGRRVKLDLLAEPSGDLDGSHKETGENLDSKNHAALSSSPSSSGQLSGNPLMLLGQYSDDEEAADLTTIVDSSYHSSKVNNIEVNESNTNDTDVEVGAEEVIIAQSLKQDDLEKNDVLLEDVEGNNDRSPNDAGDSCKDMASAVTSDVQVVGDVGSGWKIVMHEASDKYYYWNIETGETSWEVPNVLAEESGLIFEPEASKLDEDPDPSSISNATDVSKESQKISEECQIELSEARKQSADAMSDELNLHGSAGYIPAPGTSLSGNGLESEQPSDGLLNESLHRIGLEGPDTIYNEGMAEGSNQANSVVKYGEYLLERLKSLEGSLGQLQGQDSMSKYILEVEIRLSDCKSLSLYGSSLLPFWMHSEIQLKRLENCINNNICQLNDSAKSNEVKKSDDINGQTKLRQNVGDEYAEEGNDKNVISVVSSENDVVHTDGLNSRYEVHNKGILAEPFSSHSPETKYPKSVAEISSEELNRSSNNANSSEKPNLEDGEVDMDVDMEVDDELWSGNVTAPPQPPAQPYPPENVPPFPTKYGFTAPPLPDEEWIPPPPPDNEPAPPPPPDEPPQTSYPPLPSYLEAVQQISYTDQYNLSYPNPNFHYYGPALTEITSNFYGHDEGSQVVVPHPSVSYQPVSNIYSSTTLLSVEPVAPGVYDQEEKVPQFPVANDVRPSEYHSPYTEAGPQIYASLASNSSRYVSAPTAVSLSSLPAEKEVLSNGSGAGGISKANINAPVASSLKESVPVILTDAVNSAAPASATSASAVVQSKVVRGKKRTAAVVPSMRSNKKVSSMVDKWKAAKEEMHDDEDDEPEDALEALEKKKQMEIEQWRAQQIASGEAKYNANFQPLGCDWRERVKRRKAQLARAAKKLPPEAVEQNQQPDLVELSKDLPSGWQAYYDESSKKVYYGNAITSDTSWTRPTK